MRLERHQLGPDQRRQVDARRVRAGVTWRRRAARDVEQPDVRRRGRAGGRHRQALAVAGEGQAADELAGQLRSRGRACPTRDRRTPARCGRRRSTAAPPSCPDRRSRSRRAPRRLVRRPPASGDSLAGRRRSGCARRRTGRDPCRRRGRSSAPSGASCPSKEPGGSCGVTQRFGARLEVERDRDRCRRARAGGRRARGVPSRLTSSSACSPLLPETSSRSPLTGSTR